MSSGGQVSPRRHLRSKTRECRLGETFEMCEMSFDYMRPNKFWVSPRWDSTNLQRCYWIGRPKINSESRPEQVCIGKIHTNPSFEMDALSKKNIWKWKLFGVILVVRIKTSCTKFRVKMQWLKHWFPIMHCISWGSSATWARQIIKPRRELCRLGET